MTGFPGGPSKDASSISRSTPADRGRPWHHFRKLPHHRVLGALPRATRNLPALHRMNILGASTSPNLSQSFIRFAGTALMTPTLFQRGSCTCAEPLHALHPLSSRNGGTWGDARSVRLRRDASSRILGARVRSRAPCCQVAHHCRGDGWISFGAGVCTLDVKPRHEQ